MKTFCGIIMITFLGLATALAQPGRGAGFGQDCGPKGQGFGGGPGYERLADELDLTAEQQKQLRAARYEWREAVIDLRAAVQKTHLKTRRLLMAETVDRDALMKAVEEEGAAEMALRMARIEHQLKIREMLGPEKAARLMEMRGPGKGRGQGWGPRWMPDEEPEEPGAQP